MNDKADDRMYNNEKYDIKNFTVCCLSKINTLFKGKYILYCFKISMVFVVFWHNYWIIRKSTHRLV